jgi:hypothetical protein
LKGEKDLKDHATKFYKTLYMEHEQIENNHQAKVQCLKTVSQLVMEDQNIAFTAKVTKKELHSAIKALLMNKTPCIDYISTEFYQVMWESLEDNIFSFVKHVLDKGTLS